MKSPNKQLAPIKSFQEKELHKSPGILDDHAVRKSECTREAEIQHLNKSGNKISVHGTLELDHLKEIKILGSLSGSGGAATLNYGQFLLNDNYNQAISFEANQLILQESPTSAVSISCIDSTLGDIDVKNLTAKRTTTNTLIATGTIYSGLGDGLNFDFADDIVSTPVPAGDLTGLGYTVKFTSGVFSGNTYSIVAAGDANSWNSYDNFTFINDLTGLSGGETFEVYLSVVSDGTITAEETLTAKNSYIQEQTLMGTDSPTSILLDNYIFNAEYNQTDVFFGIYNANDNGRVIAMFGAPLGSGLPFFDMRAMGTGFTETLFGTSMAGSCAMMAQAASNYVIGNYSNNPMTLGTNNKKRMIIEAAGDTYFYGDSVGLPYGSCYGNEISWSQANAAQNTWYNVSDTDMTDGQLNAITHDGSGKLTITVAGRYLINYSASVACSANNHHIEGGIEVSGSGSADNNGICSWYPQTASAEGVVNSTLILDLAANATIEFAIRTSTAGTPTLSVNHLNISAVHVGGT